jgi:hypothetical protein
MPVGLVVTVVEDGGADGTVVVGGAVVQIPVATVVVVVVDADGFTVVVTAVAVFSAGIVIKVGGCGTLKVVLALEEVIAAVMNGKVAVSVVKVTSEVSTVVVTRASC